MTADSTGIVTMRPARAADIPDLLQLMHEHAAYEKSAPPSAKLADRLPAMLFAPTAPIPFLTGKASTRKTKPVRAELRNGERGRHL